jgi:hypothetical protein
MTGSRPVVVTAAAIVAVTAVAGGGWAGTSALRGTPQPTTGVPLSVRTAPVVQTDIVNTIQVSGAIGYAGSYTVVSPGAGTAYTWLPATGAIIHRGQALFEVDGSPVTLFYGARPQWRALSWGAAPGPDVAQLDRNLLALGYGRGFLTVSEYFTGSTAAAVAQWQRWSR